jgi:very-short-patch-repair endonuclease
MRAQIAKGPLESVYELAKKQHGAVARRQALEVGMSPSAITRRVKAGVLRQIMSGVYVVAGHEITWKTRLMAAVLWGGEGTVASHRAAAAVWGLPGSSSSTVEITTPSKKAMRGVVVHRRSITKRHTKCMADIPVTSIHRTLIDLGDVVSRDRVEDALDNALLRGLTSADYLAKELARLGTKGRRGAATLGSWLERRFIRFLGEKLPPFKREHPSLQYFIDFAWPEALLAVEVHGMKWHLIRLRWPRDLVRHNELSEAGWTILHLTWKEIRDEPDKVLQQILNIYDRLTGRRLFRTS